MSDLNPSHGIIHSSCEVACNHCGNYQLGLKHPATQAAAELRELGWQLIERRWYCRACVERKAYLREIHNSAH